MKNSLVGRENSVCEACKDWFLWQFWKVDVESRCVIRAASGQMLLKVKGKGSSSFVFTNTQQKIQFCKMQFSLSS